MLYLARSNICEDVRGFSCLGFGFLFFFVSFGTSNISSDTKEDIEGISILSSISISDKSS